MKAKPILFSTPMVQALLEGTKTQTRRVVEPHPVFLENGFWSFHRTMWSDGVKKIPVIPAHSLSNKCPYGKVGDFLWVKENFFLSKQSDKLPSKQDTTGLAMYEAGGGANVYGKKRSSLFMPRWASRLTLKITDIRIERLQDISEEGAIAEGISMHSTKYATLKAFETLWESIKGKGSWEASPWVWVLSFEVINKNVDDVLRTGK